MSHQQHFVAHSPEGLPALLAVNYAVLTRQMMRIFEYELGRLEAHAVLALVAAALRLIPREHVYRQLRSYAIVMLQSQRIFHSMRTRGYPAYGPHFVRNTAYVAVWPHSESLAKRINASRSELCGRALREFAGRHAPDQATEQMDRIIENVGEDAVSQRAARRVLKRIEW